MNSRVQQFEQAKAQPGPLHMPARYFLQGYFRHCCWLIYFIFTIALALGETRYFEPFDWRVYSDEVKKTSAGIELGETYLRLPAALGYTRLTFPFMVFDNAGSLKNCGLGKDDLQFTDINGLQVTVNAYQLKDQGAYGAGLYLNGSVLLTSASQAEIKLQFTNLDLFLAPNGEVRFEQAQAQSAPVALILAGWNLQVGKISTNLAAEAKKLSPGTLLENITLTLPNQQSKLSFTRLCLDVDGYIIEAGEDKTPGALTVNTWQLQYQTSRFTNEGLIFTQVQLAIPGLGKANQPIPAVQLNPDGTLAQNKSDTVLTWNYGDFSLQLNQYLLKGDALQAKEIQLTFPSALGRKQLKANSGRLESSGTLAADNAPFENLELFGFIFSLAEVQFQTDQVAFSGQVLEPYARLSYPLHEFVLTKDGTTKALTIVAEDKQPQPLLEKEWG